jgi:hypothetical protein
MDRPTTFGARLARTLRNLLVFSVVVGAAGAAVYALSRLNSRTYSLEVRDGRLVVLKGRLLPTGAEPWQPADPALADAYAPIELEGNTALTVVGVTYPERDELDRALFGVLFALASPRIASDSPKDLEQALAYVRRAERLSGLSAEQRTQLKKAQGDLAFYLARVRLDEARHQLEEALAQLKLAAEGDHRHRAQATVMLLAVEPQVKLLAGTLRATTSDDVLSLSKALEPTLQSMFDALKQQVAPKPTEPPSAPEPLPAVP